MVVHPALHQERSRFVLTGSRRSLRCRLPSLFSIGPRCARKSVYFRPDRILSSSRRLAAPCQRGNDVVLCAFGVGISVRRPAPRAISLKSWKSARCSAGLRRHRPRTLPTITTLTSAAKLAETGQYVPLVVSVKSASSGSQAAAGNSQPISGKGGIPGRFAVAHSLDDRQPQQEDQSGDPLDQHAEKRGSLPDPG